MNYKVLFELLRSIVLWNAVFNIRQSLSINARVPAWKDYMDFITVPFTLSLKNEMSNLCKVSKLSSNFLIVATLEFPHILFDIWCS